MRGYVWAVAFSRLLDRRLIQAFNSCDLDTRDTRPDFLPFVRSGSNAGIERLPARNTQPERNHATLMRGKLAGSPLE